MRVFGKKWMTVLATLFVIIIVLSVGLMGISQVLYQRSVRATLVDWFFSLDKTDYADPENLQKYIDDLEAKYDEDYQVTYDFKVTSRIEEYGEMKFVIMNEQEAPKQTVFYFHGGGYVSQPTLFHFMFLDKIAKKSGCEIVMVIYPKALKHTAEETYDLFGSWYPEYLDKKEHGEIIFMGDSAGGGLALGLAEVLKEEEQKVPDELILISPWLNMEPSFEETYTYDKKDSMLNSYRLDAIGKVWAGEWSLSDPRVSPINGNLEGLGKVTLFTATNELFYPQILELDKRLEESKVSRKLYEGKNLGHVWPIMPYPESKKAVEIIVETITH